ncbi:fibronectin type III domain-containing protein [archaeon]|jgi:hypothetical protein|nr:fibronectin type III domain-containing protein [archaeon]MBT6697633.1 fibronectin type III domain-containing protein [archaeon]
MNSSSNGWNSSFFDSGYWKFIVIVVAVLMINLPVAFAINITGTASGNVTDSGAIIDWETDEEADSLVSYGTSIDSIDLEISSSDNVMTHSLEVSGLDESTEYFFSVASSNVDGDAFDDNEGNYYSFTTEAASESTDTEDDSEEEGSSEDGADSESSGADVDTSASINLVVNEIASPIPEDEVSVSGSAAIGTEVRVYVNGGYFAKDIVDSDLVFALDNVPLTRGDSNVLTFEGTLGDQIEEISVVVVSDTSHPELTLESVNSIIDEATVTIKGQVNELSSLLFLVGGEESGSEESVIGSFSKDVSLEEGKNTIVVRATDLAGLSVEETVRVVSDTQDPSVDAEFEKGEEYYQNRAETDITGTTEADAVVFLYVYRPQSYDQSPDFSSDDVWDVVRADSDGEFVFSEVNFENEPVLSFLDKESTKASLLSYAPKQVPAGLENEAIKGIGSTQSADSFSYNVYIIAVDQSGKKGYFKEQVTVNTCYSTSFDFLINDIAKFQAPLKLDPSLLDDGREQITAVFEFDYQGDGGKSKSDLETGREDESSVRITGFQFQKACTQSMLDDEKFEVGCTIMSSDPSGVASNPDNTAHYLTWNLAATEDFSEREDDFWDEFQKRRLVFPLQVSLTYQERESDGDYGPSKTQTSCYDISYFVDVPVDSKKYIPDWLANEFVNATSFTIEKIDLVIPYLEKAILVTVVGCIASFLSKIIVRIMRLTISKSEPKLKTGEDGCPSGTLQNGYYLQSTITNWDELSDDHPGAGSSLPDYGGLVLDEVCPGTANMWKVESGIEKAYRWTCDRVFCKAAPARWTESKKVEEINDVILKQKMCGVSGACIPLEKIENCKNYVEDTRSDLRIGGSVEELAAKMKTTGGVCWLSGEESSVVSSAISSSLYYNAGTDTEGGHVVNAEEGIYRLTKIGTTLGDLHENGETVLVYQEPGTDGYCAARDQSCSEICTNPRKPGYKAVSDGYVIKDAVVVGSTDGACYQQMENGELFGSGGEEGDIKVDGKKYYAGYSSDCFVGRSGSETSFYQCICEPSRDLSKTGLTGAREALPKDDDSGTVEKYSYRQDKIFTESSKRQGTYYPDERYYAGRDFSAAFGLDYLPDYLNGKDNKKVTQVNPNTQHIGAFQTMCLSGIRARLVLLRNILDGLRTCIIEAKYTGFHDAGMCKTLFAQHMCGMIYKAITYFSNQCSPISFSDVGKEGNLFGGVVKDFSSSIEPAIQGSIDELSSDYGNAVLDQYFAGGAQGFAQSLCLAAFGYDWPLGFDFIQDAAYSVAMKTTTLVVPAAREFSSYDPESLTAVYNYNVGAVVFAGCKINSYQTYLKCIGPEDRNHPGVDPSCSGEGCDCLNARENSPFENEKTHPLDGGAGYNVQSGEMLDIAMQMPQKVQDVHYRYDHVVIELQLDANEDPTRCFEEGYTTSTGGIFYAPIKDNSPPGLISCQVQIDGTYSCPELSGLFYGEEGLGYLQTPYIDCYDKRTELWGSCDKTNLFVERDDIEIRPSLYTDGAGYCLEVEVSGSGVEYGGSDGKEILTIPSGAAGLLQPTISLGEVTSEMFGEYNTDIELDESESNDGCQEVDVRSSPSSVTSNHELLFDYQPSGDKFVLQVPKGVSIKSLDYTPSHDDGGTLKKSGVSGLTLDEINAVEFTYKGFDFSNVLGKAELKTSPSQCTHNVKRASRKSTRTETNIGVEITLLQTDANGQCHGASVPVTQTGLGKISHDDNILIQQDEIDVPVGEKSDIYEYFVAEEYSKVISDASRMIEAFEGELSEAVGEFYYVAALVMQSEQSTLSDVSTRIEVIMDRFFHRLEADGSTLVLTFESSTIDTSEFQKVKEYMCEIAGRISDDTLKKYSDDVAGGDYACD